MLAAALALALALAEGARVRLIVPPNVALPASISIEWRDAARKRIGVSTSPVVDGRLLLNPSASASHLSVIGPGLVSRSVTTADAMRNGITLVLPAELRITGLRPLPEYLRVWLLSASGTGNENLEVTTRADWTLKDGALVKDVFPGPYAAAVDLGPDAPVAVFGDEFTAAGHVRKLAWTPRSGRPLTVIALEKRTRQPIANVSAVVSVNASVVERLMVEVLRSRARESDSTGTLRFDRVAPEGLQLRLGAPGHREAVISLSEGFDGSPRKVLLALYQTLRVRFEGLKALGSHPARAVVRSCSGGKPGDSSCRDWKEHEVDEDGWATFPGAPPGHYRIALKLGEALGAGTDADVSNDSTAPDVLSVVIPLEEWHFRGKTRLPDGTPVEATIEAKGFETGAQVPGGDQLGKAASSLDGTFDLAFWAPVGRTLIFTATSERPSSAAVLPGILLSPGCDANELDLVMEIRALTVRVQDAENDNPIAGCMVSVNWESSRRRGKAGGGGVSSRTTDEGGVVTLPVLQKAVVRVQPACEGYAAREGVTVDLTGESPGEVLIKLDRGNIVLVRVRRGTGSPARAARLFAQAADSPVSNDAKAYWSEPDFLGETGEDGELSVRGDLYGGRSLFVVAPGCALAMSRLPTGTRCDSEGSCLLEVETNPPSVFPGVKLRSASGAVLPPQWIVYSKDGVAIPATIIAEVYRLNGLQPGAGNVGGLDGKSVFPSLLEPGIYFASFVVFSREGRIPKAVPVGAVTVPSNEDVVLRAMKIP